MIGCPGLDFSIKSFMFSCIRSYEELAKAAVDVSSFQAKVCFEIEGVAAPGSSGYPVGMVIGMIFTGMDDIKNV